MELGLTLGEAPPAKPPPFLPEKRCSTTTKLMGLDFGFSMTLGGRREEKPIVPAAPPEADAEPEPLSEPHLQLELMPFFPASSSQLVLPWSSEQGNSEGSNRCLDVNQPASGEEQEDGVHSSSSPPTSAMEVERFSRVSDEEENGLTRKKLRLSREQSAYLEESFKEHHTLNPKQKLALAKQLNLRPRQVEVWFQNRRARTKLKQTEVDCEYLKRCCKKLTEENRRLQKELQELRALKTSHPFYMHLPATTLTMCPSCERVASSTAASTSASAAAAAAASATAEGATNETSLPPSLRPTFYPFVPQQNQSSAGS